MCTQYHKGILQVVKINIRRHVYTYYVWTCVCLCIYKYIMYKYIHIYIVCMHIYICVCIRIYNLPRYHRICKFAIPQANLPTMILEYAPFHVESGLAS